MRVPQLGGLAHQHASFARESQELYALLIVDYTTAAIVVWDAAQLVDADLEVIGRNARE